MVSSERFSTDDESVDSVAGSVMPSAPGVCGSRQCDPHGRELKRVLYVAPSAQLGDAFLADLTRSGRCQIEESCERPQLRCADRQICWIAEHDPCVALERLGELYLNVVLLDLRWFAELSESFEARIERTMCLLDALDQTDDLEARYGFHRIVALVSGPDPERIDRLTAELGARGIGLVLRERWPDGDHRARTAHSAASFADHVLDEALRLVDSRRESRRALCAAGGGITGIYFELGALKCLDDLFGPGALNQMDQYYGISAGAVVSGLLAQGYSVAEFMAAIAGEQGGRVDQLNLSLLRWRHLNRADVAGRLSRALRDATGRLFDVVRGRHRFNLDSWVFDYGDVLGPPFRAGEFEQVLRGLFTKPGASDDFRDLGRPLYVGASDQDRRQHVLFGSEGWDHVPISRAVSASMAIHPAFAPVEIEGRYYEDGAVTRTSNFSEAIRRGANLIIVIDPFVPYVSKKPGFAADRGLLYNIDQDIRTVSFTRFETTRNWVLRKHPDVSSYTFLPSNRMRRRMSVNPMDHRPYFEIWRGAYLSTWQRLGQVYHRMRGDLAAHGITVDQARAQEVASRLAATRSPKLADFFPDRRVELPQPPLCG